MRPQNASRTSTDASGTQAALASGPPSRTRKLHSPRHRTQPPLRLGRPGPILVDGQNLVTPTTSAARRHQQLEACGPLLACLVPCHFWALLSTAAALPPTAPVAGPIPSYILTARQTRHCAASSLDEFFSREWRRSLPRHAQQRLYEFQNTLRVCMCTYGKTLRSCTSSTPTSISKRCFESAKDSPRAQTLSLAAGVGSRCGDLNRAALISFKGADLVIAREADALHHCCA